MSLNMILQSNQMKQDQISQSTSFRICDKCNCNFILPPSYTENICEKCHNDRSQTPKFNPDENMIGSEIDLECDSPKDLVMKLKKTNSLVHTDQNEDLMKEVLSHEDEVMHQSNLANNDDGEDSDKSLDEHEKHAKDKLEENIRKQQLQIKAQKKIIIGSGFTFDMTDFFNFKKKKQLTSEGEGTIFQEISGGPLSWIILLCSITTTALIPGWIMNIDATKFIRQVWRFLMQAFFMIPFMMYEKRTASQETKEKYTLSYIVDKKNIIKPYVNSLASSLWFLFILSSFQWTFVSHGIVLGSLSNFFLSITRGMRGQGHHIELGGQILVIIGLILAIQDTILFHSNQSSESDQSVQNTFYMQRTWWQRLAGDVVAILTSFMMAQFSKFTSDLRNYYPPFLSMFLVNVFNVINLTLIAFFCNGSDFDFSRFWGIYSIFTDEYFVSFMYMAIILAFGQMISVFLLTRMFPDPIIPALALTLEPFMASFIIQLANVQNLPGDFSMMGYLFIFPGMLIILMGQCFFQRQKSFTEQSDRKVKRLLSQIKQLKKLSEIRSNRAQSKQKKHAMRARTMYQSQQIISLRDSAPTRI